MRAVAGIAIATVVAGAGAAFSATVSPPRDGAAIFQDRCIYCHDARGWATRTLARRVPAGEAELTKRTELPADYTRTVVRRGIGSMPGFTPTDLSDAEVAAVARWLDRRP